MARADVKVTTDLDSSKMQAGLTRMGRGINGMVKTATAKFLALGAVIGGLRGLGGLGKLAMEAEEVDSKFNAVFKESAPQMLEVVKDLKTNIHMTTTEMKNSLSTYKAMADGMGFTQEAGNIMAESLSRLQGDLASFHNLNADEAFNKIKSAISGEFEPLKQLGIVLNEATIKQEALNLGIYDGTTALTASQKAVAVQSAIVRMMGDATGDAEATAFSSMNAYKKLNAQFKDFGEQLGTNILPLINKLVESLGGVTKRLSATNERTELMNHSLYEQAEANLLADGTLKKFLGTLHTEGNMFAFGSKATKDKILVNEKLRAEIDRLSEAQGGLNEEIKEEADVKDKSIRDRANKEYLSDIKNINKEMKGVYEAQQDQLRASDMQIKNAKSLLDLEKQRLDAMDSADTNRSGVTTNAERRAEERRQKEIERQRRRLSTAESALEGVGGEEKAREKEANSMFGDPTLEDPSTREGRILKEFIEQREKLKNMELGQMAQDQNLVGDPTQNLQKPSPTDGLAQPTDVLEDSKQGGGADGAEKGQKESEMNKLLSEIKDLNESTDDNISEIKDLMDKIDTALT